MIGEILAPARWHALLDAHGWRVEELIGPYLRERRRGHRHPVLDFLFTYYSSRPSHVRRWHPGYGIVLRIDDTARDQAWAREVCTLRGYHRTPTGVTVDPAYLHRRLDAVRSAREVLTATAARPARLGCFGLHEWAMVYRTNDIRHDHPLRLGAAGTDAVVEAMPLRCTHFDAFRFFTEPARPRNERPLSPDDRLATDQQGCLHVSMDLYRTCFTLAPLLDATLTLDAFELARDAREIDMRASPYDLQSLGYEPIAVETAAGRAHYVREQTALTRRAAAVRTRILAAIDALPGVGEPRSAQPTGALGDVSRRVT
ncbi:3-methyladenine DNA glycosylase [Gordonia sp. L191]|uniref:3-methyladenine DNA glycosylase n=1 Tax=Gordonia sp. L191 TaxID=2982699 RepID=UPI0024C057FA|nr:3-methyladenine DNA glycosylase [Gordonia sp. L191]WHU49250.1 3-methyladenine DNA glycosylase [Gordonia sp. L191]